MGVTESVIGQEASRERPRVQSGDFRLGGQSGGEEKSGWVFFGWNMQCLDTSAVADALYQRPWLVRGEAGPKSTIMLLKHTHTHTRLSG